MKLYLFALAILGFPLLLPEGPESEPARPAPSRSATPIKMIVKPVAEEAPDFDFYSEIVGESEVLNADLSFKPDPPKAGENLEINLDWAFYQKDEIEIEVTFSPAGSFTPVTVKLKKGEKAVIGIPKGATRVTARDKSHEANEATGEVTQ